MQSPLHIHCLGLNHTTAPVSLRERLAFSEEAVGVFHASQVRDDGAGSAVETVILSTCNRVEIYSTSAHPDFHMLESCLSDSGGVPVSEMRPHLYHYADADAVHHLLNVAAGLDSVVLGEAQILGQVTRALQQARRLATCGPLLSRLFQTAIHAGKRARTETAIGRNPLSVSSLTASLCERAVSNLPAAQVVILGAGEMAELAVEALRKRGVEKILILNRTPKRVRELVKRRGAESAALEQLEHALVRADILIASTGAPHILIDAGMVAAAMARRPERPLILIDIAVPRDIDPEAADLPNVSLFDIDNLNAHLSQSLAGRSMEMPRVEAIVAEEQAVFTHFLASRHMLPLIVDLRQRAEAIRQTELQKTLRRLPDLSEAERARIDILTRALVKKVLGAPTRRLRAEATSANAHEYAALARALFDLEDLPDAENEPSIQMNPNAESRDYA